MSKYELSIEDLELVIEDHKKQIEGLKEALHEIESGKECSACSCNCHRVASHALTKEYSKEEIKRVLTK